MLVVQKRGWHDKVIAIVRVAFEVTAKEVRAKSVDPIQEQACLEALKQGEISDILWDDDVITSVAKHTPLKADPRGPQP